MAAEKREKIKLTIVIGLSVVFMTVAYFRFMPQKESSSAAAAPAASVADPQTAIPRVELKHRPMGPATQSSGIIGQQFIKRDIFSPQNIPIAEKAEKKPAAQNPAGSPPPEPMPLPSLKLGGTIVGGDQPIAIINDQFVRTGETISGFEVLQIEKFAVQLAAGKRTIRLEMIDND